MLHGKHAEHPAVKNRDGRKGTPRYRYGNIVGMKFGRLTVMSELPDNRVSCRCDCGNAVEVSRPSLIRKDGQGVKSCGCLRLDHVKNMEHSIRKSYRNSKSGVVGVSWNKWVKKWYASIGYKGKQINLGYFKEMEDAVNARKEAEEKYYAIAKSEI